LRICVRREHKDRWERRAPLTPHAVERLRARGLDLCVESSPDRVFGDQQYRDHGVPVVSESGDADMVIGIKEPPVEAIRPGQVHLAFSHTIKGQRHNMPMLRRFIECGSTLIDYEAMVGENGKRIIAFGRFAGIAGTIDTLWLAGQKLMLNGRSTELTKLTQTHTYGDIRTLQGSLSALRPLVDTPIGVVIVGTGAVGKGSEEVFQWMGLRRVSAEEIIKGDLPRGPWYASLSRRELFQPLRGDVDLRDYRRLGKKGFVSCFQYYLGRFDVMIHASYWDGRYPRHLDLERLKKYETRLPWMIGDLSCDVDGSLACTKKTTKIDAPAYTYQVASDRIHNGLSWLGPSVMAVDNLPCQLPVDSSRHFSSILEELLPKLVAADVRRDLDQSGLPPAMCEATVVYGGRLTSAFHHLASELESA